MAEGPQSADDVPDRDAPGIARLVRVLSRQGGALEAAGSCGRRKAEWLARDRLPPRAFNAIVLM